MAAFLLDFLGLYGLLYMGFVDKLNISNPSDCYVIGFLRNRGYVNKTSGEIRIQCVEPLYLQSLLNTSCHINGHTLRTYNRELVAAILFSRQLSLSLIHHTRLCFFIHGYFDAHSCIYLRGGKYLQVVMTGERTLIYEIQDILIRVGVCSISKPYKKSYQLVISKQKSINNFKSFIYQGLVRGMENKKYKLFSV